MQDNIADNVGSPWSYAAFEKWLRGALPKNVNPPTMETMPAMNYSNRQLVFIP